MKAHLISMISKEISHSIRVDLIPSSLLNFWKNKFQPLPILQIYQKLIWRCSMARLPQGEKQRRLSKVSRLLNRCRLGLTEQEVSEEMGWDRRTTNNYLRELDQNAKVYRNGRKWYPD
jgi:hypothetical protein